MEIIEDVLGGWYRDNADGPSAMRRFLVTDIAGLPSAVPVVAVRGLMVRAGVSKGQPYPGYPELTVLSSDAAMASSSSGRQVIVGVHYGVPSPSEGQISATGPGETDWSVVVATEQTSEDINGDPMVVNYAGRPDVLFTGGLWRASTGWTKATTIVAADVDRPLMRATNRRREASFPVDEAVEYAGAVNSRPWSGFPAKSWLCAGVRGQRDGDGVMVYRDYLYARYRPELARRTWEFMGEFPFQRYRANDMTLGNGREVFDVYPTLDFNIQGVALR